jgi:hypothetical protein
MCIEISSVAIGEGLPVRRYWTQLFVLNPSWVEERRLAHPCSRAWLAFFDDNSQTRCSIAVNLVLWSLVESPSLQRLDRGSPGGCESIWSRPQRRQWETVANVGRFHCAYLSGQNSRSLYTSRLSRVVTTQTRSSVFCEASIGSERGKTSNVQ